MRTAVLAAAVLQLWKSIRLFLFDSPVVGTQSHVTWLHVLIFEFISKVFEVRTYRSRFPCTQKTTGVGFMCEVRWSSRVYVEQRSSISYPARRASPFVYA